jgi:hypothetical protein
VVHPGDHISYNGSHRDTGMACAYIPPLMAADDGPAAPAHAPATPPAQVALARPAAQPAIAAQPAQSCTVTTMPGAPTVMSGTVIGVIDHNQSLRTFANTGAANGGAVNPAFLNDERVMVQPDPGTNGGSRNPVVPANMHVAIGDHVTYQTPYRDPASACQFIPSVVTADQGPAARPGNNASALNAYMGVAPLPPPSAPQPGANPAEAAIAPDLPIGTVVVQPGMVSRVNLHSRWIGTTNFPVTITMLTPPAHGTVTTLQATGPQRDSAGVVKIVPVTEVFYQSAPGYSGTDSFTYRRTTQDPTDPGNGREYTVNIDVAASH